MLLGTHGLNLLLPLKVFGMKNFAQLIGGMLKNGFSYSMTANFNGFVVVLSVFSGMMSTKILSVRVKFF